jgi:hypothetical protein
LPSRRQKIDIKQKDVNVMPKKAMTPDSQDIRAAYSAIVDYHNNLAQMRFTLVGIFLATNGFLVTGLFQASPSLLSIPALHIIGFVLAGFFWLIEVRTYQLLENLAKRGLDLEQQLGLNNDQGFFFLMEEQPIDAKLLPTELKIPPTKLISHTLWISTLYSIVGLIWLIILIVSAY